MPSRSGADLAPGADRRAGRRRRGGGALVGLASGQVASARAVARSDHAGDHRAWRTWGSTHSPSTSPTAAPNRGVPSAGSTRRSPACNRSLRRHRLRRRFRCRPARWSSRSTCRTRGSRSSTSRAGARQRDRRGPDNATTTPALRWWAAGARRSPSTPRSRAVPCYAVKVFCSRRGDSVLGVEVGYVPAAAGVRAVHRPGPACSIPRAVSGGGG